MSMPRVPAPLKVLSPKLRMILLEGPKVSGSYDPARAFSYYEESMTSPEVATASLFLRWLVANGLTFGHGNLDARWAQWQSEAR